MKKETIVKTKDGQYVEVMTCNFFLSFRTHVLPCDAEGNILDWDYLDFHRCSYEEELLQSHEEMCKKWENATISGDGKTL